MPKANYLLNKMILLLIKISLANLTPHTQGGNNLLNKMIVLVIKISLTGDPDTPIFST
jgi:hypothetical protein